MVACLKNNHGPVIEENVGSHIIDALELICEDDRDDDFQGFLCHEIKQDQENQNLNINVHKAKLNTKILQLPLILSNIRESQKTIYNDKQKEKLLVNGFGDEVVTIQEKLYELCSQLNVFHEDEIKLHLETILKQRDEELKNILANMRVDDEITFADNVNLNELRLSNTTNVETSNSQDDNGDRRNTNNTNQTVNDSKGNKVGYRPNFSKNKFNFNLESDNEQENNDSG